jgi:large subunit ribosomal protein L29
MTRAAEFYAMDPDELASRLVETRRELLNLRFQLATGQLDNVSQIKSVRRDVARVLTVLREMEIASTEGVVFEAPAPQPARVQAQRRDREVAEGLRAPEAPEIDDEDQDEELDADTEPAKGPRLRRSRRGSQGAEESAGEAEESAETGSTRTRGRRSRQSEEVAEVPADVDEEQ